MQHPPPEEQLSLSLLFLSLFSHSLHWFVVREFQIWGGPNLGHMEVCLMGVHSVEMLFPTLSPPPLCLPESVRLLTVVWFRGGGGSRPYYCCIHRQKIEGIVWWYVSLISFAGWSNQMCEMPQKYRASLWWWKEFLI